MPELPEVECLTRAIRGLILGTKLVEAKFWRSKIRHPIPVQLFQKLFVGQKIESVKRRSKYILWETKLGWGLVHLGMTGNLLRRDTDVPSVPHTHATFTFEMPGKSLLHHLHYVDPRRFGQIDCFFHGQDKDHPLLQHLGPEPLDLPDLDRYLWKCSRRRRCSIKSFLMNSRVVVGIGNIYANESLYHSRIRPDMPAEELTQERSKVLAISIKKVLQKAIKSGGTSFRDFKNTQGTPGYFALKLAVYQRSGKPCMNCRLPIETVRIGGRSTFFCPHCQK